MSFDGRNPNSIVILDNCSVHHVAGVASMITQVGALVYFLLPYSPDLNPIKERFSKIKSLPKSMETTYQDDLETDVLAAFSCITPDDCQGWISESAVYIFINPRRACAGRVTVVCVCVCVCVCMCLSVCYHTSCYIVHF